jgi:hypothetical protein
MAYHEIAEEKEEEEVGLVCYGITETILFQRVKLT